ncbi:MAG TPA: hypothetical protein VE978_16410 [Chitinophagales bacterium]|nr:hypothetical protein [Chitinophagales bacterium]
MKKIIIPALAALILISVNSHAQNAPLPKNYSFKTDQDYKDNVGDVTKCMNWLLKTPVKTDDAERKEVSAYVLMWMTGTNDVSVTVFGYVTDLSKKNPDLLFAWMCGYALNVLNNPKASDAENNLSGVRAAISLYQLGGDIKKDKKLEELIEKDKSGALEAWVKEQMAVK